MKDFSVYSQQLLDIAQRVLGCDSPSGYTANALALTKTIAEEMGYPTDVSKRGALRIMVDGRDNSKTVACYAHLDTLGLSLRHITGNGELLFTRIGGPILPTLDGEYCRIYTREGKVYTGTILSLSPAAHVFKDASTRTRDEENMYVRLDVPVKSKADVEALGIRCGDIICIDPKTQVTDTGYLKSRFIDDKASVAVLLTALLAMKELGLKPKHRTNIVFTVYEEVGSGCNWFPEELQEFLIVDMGCVGPELNCSEQQVSICAKDSSGPFDYEMTTRLIHLAEENGIDYAVDDYPYYSSDAAVAWKAGCDAPAGLIGSGVHASHGMERTHIDGLMNTLKLVMCYLDCN